MYKLFKFVSEWLQINNSIEDEPDDVNYSEEGVLKEEDFYFIGDNAKGNFNKMYFEDNFKNARQLELMNHGNGLVLSLPYWQGLNSIYIMYEPRLLELKTYAKIKAPKEYIYRGFYQICYKCPLETHYRLAYYNYLRNEIRGDYKPMLPYFNRRPHPV